MLLFRFFPSEVEVCTQRKHNKIIQQDKIRKNNKDYSRGHKFRAIVGFSKLGKIFVSFDPNELATSSFFY